MKIKIDFQLNRYIDIVEKLLFRLVLNGFTDAGEIEAALPIFSDSVLANAIRDLVNRQILIANIETGRITLSEPVIAIIDRCLQKEYEVDIPIELQDQLANTGIIISDSLQGDSRILKMSILNEMLPGIKLDIYVSSLDFILYEKKGVPDE